MLGQYTLLMEKILGFIILITCDNIPSIGSTRFNQKELIFSLTLSVDLEYFVQGHRFWFHSKRLVDVPLDTCCGVDMTFHLVTISNCLKLFKYLN